MAKDTEKQRGRSKKRIDASTSSSSSSSSSESPVRRKSRSHRSSSSRHRDNSSSGLKRTHRSERRREKEGRRKSRRRRRRHSSSSDSEDDTEFDPSVSEKITRAILEKFPTEAADLEQLLQMIDGGEGVDISGIASKPLVKLLEKLFFSLKLEKSEDGIFLLPPGVHHTLDIIGPILHAHFKSRDNFPTPSSPAKEESAPSAHEHTNVEANTGSARPADANDNNDFPGPPRRRVIGPEMPSRELLAAAAELTEAETLLREADMEADDGLLIGPPPPAMVAEAATANEAERFEEVARIAAAEADKPYDVLGVNWKMAPENMKKRYWKLSLMVHPDKCPHPQANQAFVKLNQAFKDLQDPAKRQAIDDKIKLKEEEEEMKAQMLSLHEAAQWREKQGISMEGDQELLAFFKGPQKRDEWMTTLPPERKPGGMPTQSTTFSRTTKEGRGDTSMWTNSPLDKSEMAKQNYLEAYNKTKALADVENIKKVNSDADLVDKYNSSKRSKSLVEKHREEGSKNSTQKKKQKQQQQQQQKKEEWAGNHPWKPFDREKDLTGGRKSVNLDSENMVKGLTSRFSGGTVQRNFL